jgi:hypothetical protein
MIPVMHGRIELPKNNVHQVRATDPQKLSIYGIQILLIYGIRTEHPRQRSAKPCVTINDFLFLKPPSMVVILPPIIIPRTGPVDIIP